MEARNENERSTICFAIDIFCCSGQDQLQLKKNNSKKNEVLSFKKGKLLYKDNFDGNLENWVPEMPKSPASVVVIKNKKFVIDVNGGATVWLNKKLSGNIMITYKRKVVMSVVMRNIKGRAENSVRINGTRESRISNIKMENVNITLDRWTNYKGSLFDNRPTTTYPGIEPHGNPGYYIRFADNVQLKSCTVQWGKTIPDYFTHALEAHDVTNVRLRAFRGKAAHPERDKAIVIEEVLKKSKV